jgi:hypothetical protein
MSSCMLLFSSSFPTKTKPKPAHSTSVNVWVKRELRS